MEKYLEPAHTVIRKFAVNGKLSSGIDLISEITGSDRTSVYRWMRPKEKGGTGGLVPTKQQPKLLEYAKENRLALATADFFGVAHEAA
jgi:transposase